MFEGSICLIAPFLLPLILGIAIMRRNPRTELTSMAGILTLKPLFLTPIWALLGSMLNTSESRMFAVVAMLPAILVTLAVAFRFRALLGYHLGAMILLVLDVVRWGSTLMLSLVPSSSIVMCGLMVASLSMPTIFAIFAWAFAKQDVNEQEYQYAVDTT